MYFIKRHFGRPKTRRIAGFFGFSRLFQLSGSDKLKGLIDGYVLYSVNDEPLSKTVGSSSSTEKDSVYQTTKDDVPHLNWYLGDMEKGESRTLHYRVKLNTEKMEETDFTKGGTILPNDAEAFSGGSF